MPDDTHEAYTVFMAQSMRIHETDHAILTAAQEPGESLADTLHRLIETHNPFSGIDHFMGDPQTDPEYLASLRYEQEQR